MLSNIGSLFAAQVVVPCAADTSLWERDPDDNLGGMELLPAGTVGKDGNWKNSRLLMKFDIGAHVPAGAIIQSATIGFHVVRVPDPMDEPGPVLSTFYGSRVLRDWGEGDKVNGGDPTRPLQNTTEATEGDATWNNRFHGVAGGEWFEPGGEPFETDFSEDSEYRFIFFMSGVPDDYAVALHSRGVADVQEWLDTPTSNFGWVFRTQNELAGYSARIIASREHGTVEWRPTLTVDYTMPLEISEIALAGDTVTVRFPAEPGKTYVPEFRSSFAEEWGDLGPLGPLNEAGELEFTRSVSAEPAAFYRVREEP